MRKLDNCFRLKYEKCAALENVDDNGDFSNLKDNVISY
jgi:hypothetical protein